MLTYLIVVEGKNSPHACPMADKNWDTIQQIGKDYIRRGFTVTFWELTDGVYFRMIGGYHG